MQAMIDFYPVLARAIANLPDNSVQMRGAIYARAREVMVAQLRGSATPMSETEIANARLSLDETIDRLEAEQLAALDLQEAASSPSVTAAVPPVPDEREQPAPEQAVQAIAEPVVSSRPRLQTRIKRAGDSTGRKRAWIVGGGVAAAVAIVAAAGFYVNRGEPQPVRTGIVEAPNPNAAAGGKLGERIGTEAVPAQRAPGGASSGTQAAPPVANPANRPALAVAQRAVLYIENADGSQQPVIGTGRVSWRLDTEVAGQGQQAETVVRADLEFADQGLRLTFTIRRNLDPAFPASHILGLRFARSSDDGNGAVKEAGVPQFKSDETERGAPLSAITSALGDNLFVAALSKVAVEQERNVELITKRNWIDVPVRFASGKRGIVAFEKGFSGDQTLNDAFNRWR
jgi:hypothetical protein